MRGWGRVAAIVACIALMASFLVAGLLACMAPPVTHVLAQAFADAERSPLGRDELTHIADAARDYSFGAHDERELLLTIRAQDLAWLERRGTSAPAGFPDLAGTTEDSSLEELRSAFAGASETFVYSREAIAHLDDCHALLTSALPVLAILSGLGLVCLVLLGISATRRAVGAVLLVAGTLMLASFTALAVWAIVDFNGLFTAFHQVLFAQGNWQFAYDSLLICSLPTEFWMGMGAVWATVTLLVSFTAAVVGRYLRVRSRGRA